MPASLSARRTILACLLALAVALPASAQSGWVAGHAYVSQGGTDVVCGAPYSVFAGYNPWGPVYQSRQDCQRRVWTSWYGTRGGYHWAYTGYGYGWVSFQDTRTWWSFHWNNFTRTL